MDCSDLYFSISDEFVDFADADGDANVQAFFKRENQ